MTSIAKASISNIDDAITLVFRSLRRDFLSRDSLQLHMNLFVAMVGLGVFTLCFDYIWFNAIDRPTQAIYLKNPVYVSFSSLSQIYIVYVSRGRYSPANYVVIVHPLAGTNTIKNVVPPLKP